MSDAASDAPTDAMTAEEVALRLKISKSGVYALIKAGAIGHYKVGRKIRFSAAQLRAYVEGTACPAARPGPVVL
ncbi:DNA-binding protein (plasmid) [Rhodobacter capsulatus SB 1003]|jgi:putative molybdopterin biosynthesis protein|uniref:DNA-binding protein n=1 Tax=Rhodobacter capsulatus (strain ATCC BAA-309 / NBRC 16581 / SB1003) TaxID=272942 RepID=D5AVL0_RHOCB|nr:DNA-binding protein [Rhodobacter capsulatus SB 1003]